MKLFKISLKTANKIEMFKKLYSIYGVVSDLNLSDSDITLMSYYNVYGVNDKTERLIFKTGAFTNHNTFKNTKAKLRRLKLLNKPKHKSELIESLQIPVEAQLGVLIKFDNS